MKQSTIGGTMTANAWQLLANRHRPSDSTALAAEIVRLHSTRLTPRDIAQALGLPLDTVINNLRGEHHDQVQR